MLKFSWMTLNYFKVNFCCTLFILFLLRTCYCECIDEGKRIVCSNTTSEDYMYEINELGRINSVGITITNSNLQSISRLMTPYLTTTLSKIILRSCNISKVALDAFEDVLLVSDIDLSFNKITDIGFLSRLRSNWRAVLSHNNIKHLCFDKNFVCQGCVVEFLDLSYNHIEYVLGDLSLLKIKRIDLSHNKIRDFELNSDTYYHSVNLAFNDLRNLKIYFIEELNLSNAIAKLEPVSIRNLVASKIIISDTSMVEQTFLTYSQNIQISNCSLKMIDCDFGGDKRVINLSHNDISSIHSEILIHVEELDVSYNKFDSIMDITNVEMSKLNMRHNHLTTLKFSDFFKKLLYLDLSHNAGLKVTFDSFWSLKKLVSLELSFCDLVEIPIDVFRFSQALKRLILANNLINHLPSGAFQHLHSIQDISLKNNSLKKLDPYVLGSIPVRTIDLSENTIALIGNNAFYNLTQLLSLKIDDNRHKLEIERNAFNGLVIDDEYSMQNSKLLNIKGQSFHNVTCHTLNLNRNPLNVVDFRNSENFRLYNLRLSFEGNIKTKSFLSLTELETLVFQNSNILNIEGRAFLGLFHLKNLEMRNSSVLKFEPGFLKSLFSMQILDMKMILKYMPHLYNHEFNDMHSLEILDLSHLNLSTLSEEAFEGLSSLVSLDLNNNKLESFGGALFTTLSQLKLLDLSHNNLKILYRDTFTQLKNVRHLYLDHNNINDIELGSFQHLQLLEYLSLSNNNLTEFKVGTFSNLHDLQDLSLQNNNISKILLETLLPLKGLRHLNLDSNHLKSIQYDLMVTALEHLKEIDISRNKWKCEDLSVMLTHFRKHHVDYSSVNLNFDADNIEGIECVDICKYLLCLKDSHGIN